LLPRRKAGRAIQANAPGVEFGATVAFDGGESRSCFGTIHACRATKVRGLLWGRVEIACFLEIG